jgi:sulfate adenylyltransferase subunit 1 (EFTu-like GTPase family)
MDADKTTETTEAQSNAPVAGQQNLEKVNADFQEVVEQAKAAQQEPAPVARRVSAEEGANVSLAEGQEALSQGPVSIGTHEEFYVPSEAQQRAGFRIPEKMVSIFIGQFRQFKRFVQKGE